MTKSHLCYISIRFLWTSGRQHPLLQNIITVYNPACGATHQRCFKAADWLETFSMEDPASSDFQRTVFLFISAHLKALVLMFLELYVHLDEDLMKCVVLSPGNNLLLTFSLLHFYRFLWLQNVFLFIYSFVYQLIFQFKSNLTW